MRVKKVMMYLLVVVMFVCLYKILGKWLDDQQANKKYISLSEEFTDVIPIPYQIVNGDKYLEEDKLPDDDRVPPLKIISFENLRKINPEFVAWIDFGEEVGIDYPIVQSKDEYYLTHSFEDKKNANGCLFIHEDNNRCFEDLNTAVWGHNMKSRRMFGNLREYKKESYYDEHPYFWIYTQEENLLYRIISVHDVPVSSPAFWISLETEDRKEAFFGAVEDGGKDDAKALESKYENIVTLCTCNNNRKTRLLVHGQLLYKSNRTEENWEDDNIREK